MRADRDAGTEKSAVQVSTCAGTCRPQSRFSHASIVGIVERRKMVVQPPGKKVANRREKSGYNIKANLVLVHHPIPKLEMTISLRPTIRLRRVNEQI